MFIECLSCTQALNQVKGTDRAGDKADEVPAVLELNVQWEKTAQQINNRFSDTEKHSEENGTSHEENE